MSRCTADFIRRAAKSTGAGYVWRYEDQSVLQILAPMWSQCETEAAKSPAEQAHPELIDIEGTGCPVKQAACVQVQVLHRVKMQRT